MSETEIFEMPVRMSTDFKRLGDRAKVQKLVDCIMHNDPTLKNDAWLLGVGKMFYDLGAGVDIWDTSDCKAEAQIEARAKETK